MSLFHNPFHKSALLKLPLTHRDHALLGVHFRCSILDVPLAPVDVPVPF